MAYLEVSQILRHLGCPSKWPLEQTEPFVSATLTFECRYRHAGSEQSKCPRSTKSVSLQEESIYCHSEKNNKIKQKPEKTSQL